jgi:hypothetical protein
VISVNSGNLPQSRHKLEQGPSGGKRANPGAELRLQ